jgi:hypothetical protein
VVVWKISSIKYEGRAGHFSFFVGIFDAAKFFYTEDTESVCLKFAHFFHSSKRKLYTRNLIHFKLQFLSFRNSHHHRFLANRKEPTFHTV